MSSDLKLQITLLKKRVEEITDIPTFRGIPVDDPRWPKEALVLICTLFANEMRKYQNKYYETLRSKF